MPDLPLFITVVSVFLTFGLLGAQLGKRSGGRPQTWFIWGFVLGPVGWLAALAAQSVVARRQP